MEKLSMETKDWTSENVEKIGALFPQAITETRDAEDKLRKALEEANE